GGDHLSLAAEPLGKKRADRAIDQPRDERLVLARASFALEIAARNLAGSEGLFLVVDGKREEVDASLGFLRSDDGGEHGRLAVGSEDGAIRLPRKFPGLEPKLAPSPIDFDTLDVEHGSSFHDASGTRKTSHGQDGKKLSTLGKASGDPAMAGFSSSCENAAAPCRRVAPR